MLQVKKKNLFEKASNVMKKKLEIDVTSVKNVSEDIKVQAVINGFADYATHTM